MTSRLEGIFAKKLLEIPKDLPLPGELSKRIQQLVELYKANVPMDYASKMQLETIVRDLSSQKFIGNGD